MDCLAHFCLKFGHITVILPLVMVGMIFHKREVYAKATCFLLWVMVINTLLKQLFKVPLFPHLGSGYAFPSGHMHASAIFYGYLLYKTNNKAVRVALLALLCCLGSSLVYCNFHDWFDVLGAVGFSIAEIFAYHLISKNFGDKTAGAVAIFSAIACMLVLHVIFKVEWHVWLAFYGLAGMTSMLFFVKEQKLQTFLAKIIALGIAAAIVYGVNYVFNLIAFNAVYLSTIKFALIPWIIAFSVNVAKKHIR